jgi:hypothetical protein
MERAIAWAAQMVAQVDHQPEQRLPEVRRE